MVPAMNTASKLVTGRYQLFVTNKNDGNSKIQEKIRKLKGQIKYLGYGALELYLLTIETKISIGKTPIEQKADNQPEMGHSSWHYFFPYQQFIKRQ
jgi:hypothetical protein